MQCKTFAQSSELSNCSVNVISDHIRTHIHLSKLSSNIASSVKPLGQIPKSMDIKSHWVACFFTLSKTFLSHLIWLLWLPWEVIIIIPIWQMVRPKPSRIKLTEATKDMNPSPMTTSLLFCTLQHCGSKHSYSLVIEEKGVENSVGKEYMA